MANATIIINDLEDGQVNIKLEFTPEIDMKSNGTPAQRCALQFIEYMENRHNQTSEDDE